MAERVILKLTKHYGNNNAGETCGFDPKTAEHILKHNGGELVGKVQQKIMSPGSGVQLEAAKGNPGATDAAAGGEKKQPAKDDGKKEK